jgi:hypothetical protein
MAPYFESIIGFDPDGIRRIYASTWIEARQEARNYIRNRPDTAPLSAWRFDLVKTPANVMEAASGARWSRPGRLGQVSNKEIFLILVSQMRDLLWEMVTEPLFWPVMLVLAGTFGQNRRVGGPPFLIFQIHD